MTIELEECEETVCPDTRSLRRVALRCTHSDDRARARHKCVMTIESEESEETDDILCQFCCGSDDMLCRSRTVCPDTRSSRRDALCDPCESESKHESESENKYESESESGLGFRV